MFIDDKLRIILVVGAEELGISSSILLDWASNLEEDWAREQAEGLASVVLETLRDGIIEIIDIKDQQPVVGLTKCGWALALANIDQQTTGLSRDAGH